MRGIRGRRACECRVNNIYLTDQYFSLQTKPHLVPLVLPSLSGGAVEETRNIEDARPLKGLQLGRQLLACLGSGIQPFRIAGVKCDSQRWLRL